LKKIKSEIGLAMLSCLAFFICKNLKRGGEKECILFLYQSYLAVGQGGKNTIVETRLYLPKSGTKKISFTGWDFFLVRLARKKLPAGTRELTKGLKR